MDGTGKILQLVKENSPEYKEGELLSSNVLDASLMTDIVKSLLKSGWKHSQKRKPRLCRVFKIMNKDTHYKPFVAYQYVSYTSVDPCRFIIIDVGRGYKLPSNPTAIVLRLPNVYYSMEHQEHA